MKFPCSTLRRIAVAVASLLSVCVQAQVPERVLVEGAVIQDGRPYDGVGRFKFALVNPDASQGYWSHDGTGIEAGEPAGDVVTEVVSGVYRVTLGASEIPGMRPLPATVFSHPDVHLRTWFSDGNHPFRVLAPDQPFTPVGYALMAARIAPGAVGRAELAPGSVGAAALEAGAVGASHLAPGVAAANLAGGGGMVLSSREDDPALLAGGLAPVATLSVAGDAWRRMDISVPFGRRGAAALWTGAEYLIVGGRQTDVGISTPLAGFRYDPATTRWAGLPQTGVPEWLMNVPGTVSQAVWHAIWTGSEILAWNGQNRTGRRCRLDGARWELMSSSNAPAYRTGHSAVWTGSEWILWGGMSSAGTLLANGGRYDSATDTWKAVSQVGAPSARSGHAAVWAGTAMLVLGGSAASGTPDNAVWSYDPSGDHWERLAPPGGMNLAGVAHALRVGREIVVFPTTLGSSSGAYAQGGRFNLDSRSWKPLSAIGAPLGLNGAQGASVGGEAVLWGGVRLPESTITKVPDNRGYAYDPTLDRWRELSQDGAPSGRSGAAFVSTGQELFVWGGTEGARADAERIDGGRYLARDDRWLAIAPPPLNRTIPWVTWTGGELLMWGGSNATTVAAPIVGGRFDPQRGRWRPMSTRNAPSARTGATASWTGKEWLVWGGFGADLSVNAEYRRPLGNGGAYDPSLDRWTAVPVDAVIAARGYHSAVWTGTEVLIWGGSSSPAGGVSLGTGGRYDPNTRVWRPMSAILGGRELPGRSGHSAVWTGREMLVWSASVSTNRGYRYDPFGDRWTLLSSPGSSGGSTSLPIVWAGDSMLVPLGSVRWGVYDPATDAWRVTSLAGAPSASSTTTLMAVGDDVVALGRNAGQGAVYNLRNDRWTALSSKQNPGTWSGYAAAWTGSELILVGGSSTGIRSLEVLQQTVWALSLQRRVFLYGSR